jgi:ABC-type antimicrobial peptide transport system ATPase subunit
MSLLEVRGLTTALQTAQGEISAIEDVGMGLNVSGDGLRDVLSLHPRLRIQQ